MVIDESQAAELMHEAEEAGKMRRTLRSIKESFKVDKEELKRDGAALGGTVAGAGLSGLAEGFGYLEPWGVPIRTSSAGSGLQYAARLNKVHPDQALIAKSVGNGALGWYVGRQAKEFARSIAKPNSAETSAAVPISLPGGVVAGALPEASPGPLSNQELADLIHATDDRHHRTQGYMP